MEVKVELKEYLEPKVREIMKKDWNEDEKTKQLLILFEKVANKVVKPSYSHSPFEVAFNDGPHATPLNADITYRCENCRTPMEDERR